MQSTARRTLSRVVAELMETRIRRASNANARHCGGAGRARAPPGTAGSGVRLGLQDLAAAVEAGGADVVAQMGFASRRLDRRARSGQGVVRAVHATLRRRLLVLLNGHGILLGAAGRMLRKAPAEKPSILA